MPGITGLIRSKFAPEDVAAFRTMAECMTRESFYSSGTFTEQRLGLLTSWVSHKGAFSDSMPVWNKQRDVCLIFAGENYADRRDLDRLKARGCVTDTENANYLICLYEELGLKFIEKLNGWFSGLVVDLREGKVVLFNDRYGLGRLYFHESQNGFYFSSEAKSLLKVLPDLRKLDARGLGEFLSCGCVLQNRTLFSGISLLPPASAWTFVPGQPVKKQTYFHVKNWEQQSPLSVSEYLERLKETWGRILPRYFRANESAALSLTGGVDSRMILAWAQRASGTLPCYTFGGKYRDCADVKISREVARICGQRHETITVGDEFLSRFRALAEKAVYVSDGTMDVTGSLDLYVQEIARQISPIRVTGTNGGEILRSLVAFKPARFCQEFVTPEFADQSRNAEATYAEELRGNRLSFTAFKQVPWFMGSKFVLERSQLTLRMPYFDNDLIALVYQAPVEATNNNDVSLNLIASGNPALGKLRTDRGESYKATPGISRAKRLIHDFTSRAEYAYDYGMPQWLAKLDHAVAPLRLERLFLGRHKASHFRVWYRDALAPYLREILLDDRSLNRPYVRLSRLEQMVNDHTRGVANHTWSLHKLLTVELIQRQLIERN